MHRSHLQLRIITGCHIYDTYLFRIPGHNLSRLKLVSQGKSAIVEWERQYNKQQISCVYQ